GASTPARRGLPLPLVLMSGPLRSGGVGGQDPVGAPRMDARRFPRGQDVRSENPAGSADPVQSTGRAGGVCFFAPGFFAQAKKGGSRRHGAKALDLDVAPAGRHQEQLAALAPSSALRAPSPASGRRAGVAQGAQAGVLSL